MAINALIKSEHFHRFLGFVFYELGFNRALNEFRLDSRERSDDMNKKEDGIKHLNMLARTPRNVLYQ